MSEYLGLDVWSQAGLHFFSHHNELSTLEIHVHVHVHRISLSVNTSTPGGYTHIFLVGGGGEVMWHWDSKTLALFQAMGTCIAVQPFRLQTSKSGFR